MVKSLWVTIAVHLGKLLLLSYFSCHSSPSLKYPMVSKHFFDHAIIRSSVSELLLDALKTFSEPRWPHGNLLGTPRAVTVSPKRHGPALPYEGFEKCGWSRKMTLMIYLLSLAVAGDLLYPFSFMQGTARIQFLVIGVCYEYSQWFALNVVIVWLFAIIALQWPVCKRRMFSRKGGRLTSDDLLGLMLPNQKLDIYRSVTFYKGSKGWTILAWMGVLVSVTWIVVFSFSL